MIEIRLLDNFSVNVDGVEVGALSTGTQRLIVLLALSGRSISRATVAGTLWPDSNGHRAGESLRSALSRMEPAVQGAIAFESARVGLASDVIVDLHEMTGLANRLLSRVELSADDDLSQAATAALSRELLPDWSEDWIEPDAEDWRQLRMNALEAQVRLLIDTDRLAEASGAARAAVRIEPLRESAHACVVRVHLAEGNQSEALRAYNQYRSILFRELGLEPTDQFASLVRHLRPPTLRSGRPQRTSLA